MSLKFVILRSKRVKSNLIAKLLGMSLEFVILRSKLDYFYYLSIQLYFLKLHMKMLLVLFSVSPGSFFCYIYIQRSKLWLSWKSNPCV